MQLIFKSLYTTVVLFLCLKNAFSICAQTMDKQQSQFTVQTELFKMTFSLHPQIIRIRVINTAQYIALDGKFGTQAISQIVNDPSITYPKQFYQYIQGCFFENQTIFQVSELNKGKLNVLIKKQIGKKKIDYFAEFKLQIMSFEDKNNRFYLIQMINQCNEKWNQTAQQLKQLKKQQQNQIAQLRKRIAAYKTIIISFTSFKFVKTSLGIVVKYNLNQKIPEGWRKLSIDEGNIIKEQLQPVLDRWSIVAFQTGKISGKGYTKKFEDSYGKQCGQVFLITSFPTIDI